MFIKDSHNGLVFIKSKSIRAFPCGRRRSGLVDPDNNSATVTDRYYIPFDPEARLNTEANNRKHSSLNGFKQTYLDYWKSNGDISMVLAGYLFNITSGYGSDRAEESYAKFGSAVAEVLGGSPNKLFANIKLADITFFAGASSVPEATTEILRDQTTSEQPLECLDQLDSAKLDSSKVKKDDPESYYFYGLSFSGEDLEAAEKKVNNNVSDWVSLQILDYDPIADAWKIHEASRLPKIDHGNEKDSVSIPGSLHVDGDVFVDGTLTATNIEVIRTVDGEAETLPTVSLKVEKVSAENEADSWQLRFYTK